MLFFILFYSFGGSVLEKVEDVSAILHTFPWLWGAQLWEKFWWWKIVIWKRGKQNAWEGCLKQWKNVWFCNAVEDLKKTLFKQSKLKARFLLLIRIEQRLSRFETVQWKDRIIFNKYLNAHYADAGKVAIWNEYTIAPPLMTILNVNYAKRTCIAIC